MLPLLVLLLLLPRPELTAQTKTTPGTSAPAPTTGNPTKPGAPHVDPNPGNTTTAPGTKTHAGPTAKQPASEPGKEGTDPSSGTPGAPIAQTGETGDPATRPAPRSIFTWLEELLRKIDQYDLKQIALNAGILLSLLLGLPLLLILLGRFFRGAYIRTARYVNHSIRPWRIRSVEIIKPSTVAAWLVGILRLVRLLISLLAVYFVVRYAMTFFGDEVRLMVMRYVGGALNSVFVAYTALLFYGGINITFSSLSAKIERGWGGLIGGIRIRNVEFLSEQQVVDSILLVARTIRILTMAFFGYVAITVIFSFFSFSAGWAEVLLGYILRPVKTIATGAVGYLPNILFIIIAIWAARFVLRFLRVFFHGIETGRTILPGFYSDWAATTYKIVALLLTAFTIVLIFPYLPGSQSDAFKGVGLFLGFLLSLGSTAVVANMVAGIVLTYMRPFQVGDRVKISDTTGTVVERTLLVTRIRTIKNVEVTVPNGLVLGAHITNYSSMSKETGLILHSTITIGYDVPWRDVHRLLKAAAQKTENINATPEPFILQTELSDFYVAYEINCYTSQPDRMAATYSELHQNIQDEFNAGGVEILSPHYRAQRDGNMVTIPAEHLPANYQAPAFRIENVTGENKK